jgi:hypothetical protein
MLGLWFSASNDFPSSPLSSLTHTWVSLLHSLAPSLCVLLLDASGFTVLSKGFTLGSVYGRCSRKYQKAGRSRDLVVYGNDNGL